MSAYRVRFVCGYILAFVASCSGNSLREPRQDAQSNIAQMEEDVTDITRDIVVPRDIVFFGSPDILSVDRSGGIRARFARIRRAQSEDIIIAAGDRPDRQNGARITSENSFGCSIGAQGSRIQGRDATSMNYAGQDTQIVANNGAAGFQFASTGNANTEAIRVDDGDAGTANHLFNVAVGNNTRINVSSAATSAINLATAEADLDVPGNGVNIVSNTNAIQMSPFTLSDLAGLDLPDDWLDDVNTGATFTISSTGAASIASPNTASLTVPGGLAPAISGPSVTATVAGVAGPSASISAGSFLSGVANAPTVSTTLVPPAANISGVSAVNIAGTTTTISSANVSINAPNLNLLGVPIAGDSPFVLGLNGTQVVVTDDTLTELLSSRYAKRNIQDIDNAHIRLMSAAIKAFEYIGDRDDGRSHYGVIAEEFEDLVPELIRYDENGNPRRVRYIEMVPLLLKIIQEQQETIEALQYNDALQQQAIQELWDAIHEIRDR